MSPISPTPSLTPLPNAHQMDDLLLLLGFQDLQDAQDWVIKHGQGRILPLSPPHQTDLPAHLNTPQMAEFLPDPLYLRQELDRTKQTNLQLKSTLAVAQSRIATLEEERLSRLAYQARQSNQPIKRAISSHPDMSKIGILDHPCCSSRTSLHALQSINQQLKSQNDILIKSLADEKEKMDKERSQWRAFKQRYARLVPQSISKPKTIPALPALQHHNLNLPAVSPALVPPSQKRLNDENIASSSTPLYMNIKTRNLPRGPLSPQNGHLSNQSIQPLIPISPNLNTTNHVVGELQAGAAFKLTPHHFLAEEPRPKLSKERRDGQPEDPHRFQSVTIKGRPAPDPTQVSCGGVDVMSHSSHLQSHWRPTSPHQPHCGQSPRKNQTSPRKPTSPSRQRSTCHSPHKTSPRPRLPLSHRVKPDCNTKISQRKHMTPQTVPRSKSTLGRVGTTRSALPTPKWIRYSDRKSRMANLIWKDDEEEEGGKSSSKCKGKGKGKLEPGPRQIDDTFIADKERNVGVDAAGSQVEGPSMKPVQMDLPAGMTASQEVFEELSTTEYESSSDDVFGPLQRVSSPRTTRVGRKPERDVSQTKKDWSKKVSGAENQRAHSSDSHSEPHSESSTSEDFPGQKYMRMVHKKRQEAVEQSLKKRKRAATGGVGGQGDLQARLEVDPDRNFGCGHVFDEVARGKDVRKQMRGQDCDCCAGYYEQVAKDFKKMPSRAGHSNQMAEQHQNEISRHRHFNPPPQTPPGYWQLGFPDTQQVEKINLQAQENQKIKLARLEAQVKGGIGPYRIKDNNHQE